MGRALAAGRLPELFFYTNTRSVKAWLKLCSSKPYRNYQRSLQLARRAAAALIPQLARARSVQWVSLGCGQGTKEAPFLKRAKAQGLRLHYIAWDASEPLLKMALARAARLQIPNQGIRADWSNSSHWGHLPGRDEAQVRVLSVFGNSLSAMGLAPFLKAAGRALNKGDWLLLDGEIYAGEKTLAGYDHPVNRAFAMAPLRSLGITPSDGSLRFTLRPPSKRSPIGQVRKSFLFSKDRSIRWAGKEFHFHTGQVIRMSPSDKYLLSAMTKRLSTLGPFRLARRFLHSDRRYALWLLEKR